MTPEAFRALVARIWLRQAPSSRWLMVESPAADHAGTQRGRRQESTDAHPPVARRIHLKEGEDKHGESLS